MNVQCQKVSKGTTEERIDLKKLQKTFWVKKSDILTAGRQEKALY